MKLRHQLLLVGLLTLVLPWAGVQYLRETHSILRESQMNTLVAMAQAVAVRLEGRAALEDKARGPLARQQTTDFAWYAHTLESAPVMDGYADDWREWGIPWRTLPAQAGGEPAEVLTGRYGEELFLLLRVLDSQRQFFNPVADVDQSDHIRMTLSSRGQTREFRLFTAAPGQLQVEERVEFGLFRRVHRMAGVWTEQGRHYQVEVKLPLAWTGSSLGLLARSGGSTPARPLLFPLYHTHSAIDGFLQGFTQPGLRLRVISPEGFILGEAGSLYAPEPKPERLPILNKILALLIDRDNRYELAEEAMTGRLVADTYAPALASGSARLWYRHEGQTIARASVAAAQMDHAMAQSGWLLVAEQSSSVADNLLYNASGRVLLYALLASGFVGLVLLAYASWLSWRIGRLNRLARAAVDDQGRIRNVFPVSRGRDEIAQLARNYAELLQRLRAYTSYLEDLASKLSHELRTPLAVVKTSLENLQQLDLPESGYVYTARAEQGTARLSRILNAMSAASRLEQTIVHSEAERFEFASFFSALGRAYQDMYDGNAIAVTEHDQAVWVWASPELLAQMLDKLVENAAEFAALKKARVELDWRHQGAEILLRVANSGSRLPANLDAQIFDAMVNLRDTEQSAETHLGLGLHIVRLIAQHYAGDVRAYNSAQAVAQEPGVVFEVRLPIILACDSTPQART